MEFTCTIKDVSRDMVSGKSTVSLEFENGFVPALLELTGKKLTCILKLFRKKRSLDANAYAWVLMDKLAAALHIPKDELYRGYVRNIGGNSISGCYRNADVANMCSGWQHNGLGWLADTFESKISGCTNITFYMGSSVYDTEQMSRLLDLLIQDCQAVGIETMTPQEIQTLKDKWE